MTIDIDAVRQREQAATPGPWEHGGNDGLVWPERVGDPVSASTETADAEFIAHARQDIPALLAEIDRLRAEREHMELNPTGTAEWLKNRVAELAAQLHRAEADNACPNCAPGFNCEQGIYTPAEVA